MMLQSNQRRLFSLHGAWRQCRLLCTKDLSVETREESSTHSRGEGIRDT